MLGISLGKAFGYRYLCIPRVDLSLVSWKLSLLTTIRVQSSDTVSFKMLSQTRFACLARTTPHCRSRPAASRLFVTSSAASIREERRIFDSPNNAMASTRALHSSSKVSSALKPVVYDQFLLFGASIFEQSSSQQRGFALAPALQEGEYLLSATSSPNALWH